MEIKVKDVGAALDIYADCKMVYTGPGELTTTLPGFTLIKTEESIEAMVREFGGNCTLDDILELILQEAREVLMQAFDVQILSLQVSKKIETMLAAKGKGDE